MKSIQIDKIVSEGLQARAVTNQETVDEYAEAMQAGTNFPPVTVYNDGGDVYWLADGFHRLQAHMQLGIHTISAEVLNGTRDDAFWHSLGANATHGMRRTAADKRRAVTNALKFRPNLSSRAIAQHCSVSHVFVEQLRSRVETFPDVNSCRVDTNEIRTRSDGRQFTVPPPPSRPPSAPTNYGPPPSAPSPVPPPTPPVPSKGPVDELGRTIPPETLVYFKRSQEVQDLLTAISRVKGVLERAHDAGDLLYGEIHWNRVLGIARELYDGVKVAKPFAVCPYCQGKLSSTCRACGKRGFMSEFRWTQTVPSELKEAALKNVAA